MSTDPLQARAAAYAAHARHGSEQMTRRGRAAFLARFEREVDPTGALPPEERARRAAQARRAHMLTLARRSAAVRRRA